MQRYTFLKYIDEQKIKERETIICNWKLCIYLNNMIRNIKG